MSNTDRARWNSGPVNREGLSSFIVAIRSPQDPERVGRARSLGGKTTGDEKTKAARALKKKPVDQVCQAIVEQLSDDEPRTFNRICVELFDTTADVALDTALEKALWRGVELGMLEHTMTAPVFFRARRSAESAQLRMPGCWNW